VSERLLPVRVWDAAIRLFHWAIVILLCLAWLTESLNWMRLHFLCGYSVIALLLFRLVWGFIGSETARFSRFLKSPLAALRHLHTCIGASPTRRSGITPRAAGWCW